jgi:ABC transporter with metal-binding/Fe-S-binding domain ATP-binding protein
MIGCLFSGGKDSTLALHKVVDAGKRVDLLITMVTENEYSYMFHKPAVEFTHMQAEALGLRHMVSKTKGEKEAELSDLEDIIVKSGVSELITGAVASRYQKDRIETICARHEIKVISPLWGINPLDELREIASSFNAIVTHVAAEGFDQSFLGKRIDGDMIERLIKLQSKYKINMSFEGGEAESFVLDAPLFTKRIKIRKAHTVWDGQVGTYVIDDAELEVK